MVCIFLQRLLRPPVPFFKQVCEFVLFNDFQSTWEMWFSRDFEGIWFFMPEYYWKSVWENLYGRSISQVLCKSIRQESHLTQNTEVLCSKFFNTLDLVDKNIDLNLQNMMSCQRTDRSTIEFNNKFQEACKTHHGCDPWTRINSSSTALPRYEFGAWHG